MMMMKPAPFPSAVQPQRMPPSSSSNPTLGQVLSVGWFDGVRLNFLCLQHRQPQPPSAKRPKLLDEDDDAPFGL